MRGRPRPLPIALLQERLAFQRKNKAELNPPEVVEVLYLTPGTDAPFDFHSIHFSELTGMPDASHKPVWDILSAFVLPELA